MLGSNPASHFQQQQETEEDAKSQPQAPSQEVFTESSKLWRGLPQA